MMTIDTSKNSGNPTTIAHTESEKFSKVTSSKISAIMIMAIMGTMAIWAADMEMITAECPAI